ALERANRVNPARRQMTERECEGAHDPQAIRDPDHLRRLVCNGGGEGRLERKDLDLILGTDIAESLLAEKRARTMVSRPLLARTEVVDVSETDIPHGRPVRNRQRQRKERDPSLC